VRAAAVLGPRFDWRLLAPVTGLAEPGIGAAIRAAIDAQLLVTDDPAGRPVFRHALTAEVIAADLDPPGRAALQLRAADAVASSGTGDPGERLALEARLRGAAGDRQNAAALLTALAGRAAAVGALAAAEQHLREAAELSPGNQRVSAMLLEVLVHRGQTEPALRLGRELLDSVRLVGGPRAAVELLVARACLTAGRLDEARRHLTGARRTTSTRQRAEIASVQARVALAGIGPDRVVAAEHLAHRAVAEAEAAGAPELMCESLEVAGRCARVRDLDQARKAFERALAVADEHRLALWRIRALSELGTIEMFRDVEPAGLIEARRAAAAAGALATAAGVDVNLAAVHTMRAEFSLARSAAESCEALARRCGLPDVRAAGLVFQGVVAAHQGRFADMRAHVRAAEQMAGDDPDVVVGTWAMCRGTAALLREERDDARHAFATAASSLAGRPALAINPVDGPWLLLRATAGEAGLAEVDHYAATQALGSRWSELWGGLSRAIALGELGETDAAATAAETAVAAAERMPLFLAIGLRLAAERAVAAGWGSPQSWLMGAASTFAACGHARPAAACRDLLRSAGHRVPRARAVDAVVPARLRDAGVTARESEVLTLVALRCTNAEIAGRLYLSPRTVEKHIASLLAKTGARNRIDLARAAGDTGPAGQHGG
jgi:DNA-binding CsgD family transcriptional regulator/tetratricopeptide (TPR) repeat protein